MLTQLPTIKTRLGLDLFDTTDDVLLTSLLKHVSARFAATGTGAGAGAAAVGALEMLPRSYSVKPNVASVRQTITIVTFEGPWVAIERRKHQFGL